MININYNCDMGYNVKFVGLDGMNIIYRINTKKIIKIDQ
jgi:hypothetical protein